MIVKNVYSIAKELSEAGPEARQMFKVVRETYPFIKKNKLWKGFLEHKWITLLTIVVVLLFTYFFYEFYFAEQTLKSEIADLAKNEVNKALTDANIKDKIQEESKDHFMDGGVKYLLILLQEVLLFHFSVKTQDILTGNKTTLKIKDFVKVEVRMLKVIIRNFILSLIVLGVVKVILFIIGFTIPFEVREYDFVIMFFVHGYFLAFAFFDNYLEQFELTITQSASVMRRQLGACLMLGTIFNILIHIPILGPLLAPFFAAVAATIYANRFELHKEHITLEE